ncbi:putative transcription factor, MBF1 like protein [Pseudomonas asplenii]|uniref:Putative transcription factor, MBF1 like protein n=1 Tax=Pseudomonas asplenii TaxID=53407 RepID=A0A0N0E157_9PSED|nr:helix-turn-helix domain-containing protein [Pseudomonas fuscovaginae]KPA87280.1 putative transcription factor, MBF1 like protein [Pseudomonas fuscovaginae]
MVDKKAFSERLLWARSKAGMSQKELAEKSGISVPQINRYESGKASPRLRSAIRLGHVLGVDAYDLAPELKNKTKEISISFTEEQSERLQEIAESTGHSVEELILLSIDFAKKKLAEGDEKFKADFAARIAAAKQKDES